MTIYDAQRFLASLRRGDTVTVVIDNREHQMQVTQELLRQDFAYNRDGSLGRAGSWEGAGVMVSFGVGRYSTHISVSQQGTKYYGMPYIKEATN